MLGSFDFKDEEWIGFQGKDIEAIIDLEEHTQIKLIECGFLISQGSWIFSPEKVVISISYNGIDYDLVKSFDEEANKQNDVQQVKKFKVKIENLPIRYVKVQAKNIGVCPNWHAGAGDKAWLFCDEIIIK